MRLRRRRDQEEADQDQAKILKVFLIRFRCDYRLLMKNFLSQGMKDIAKEKNKDKGAEDAKAESLKSVFILRNF